MSENYYLLDDMEKYDRTFNRKIYEHLSIKDLGPIFRDYYSKNLPVDVTTWIRVNEPDEKLIYKDGLGKQVVFIRDTIMRNMFYNNIYGDYDSDKYESFQPKVISTHRSKSVLLPVMEVNLEMFNIKMLFRYNFYDWNISVESDENIECDFKGLLDNEDDKTCYCEGFPKERIYGKYKDNHNKFTICIDDDYELYVFMFLLKDWLINRK